MKKIAIILSAFATLTLNIIQASAYTDVSKNHKYAPAIDYVESQRIEIEPEFRPNQSITREEFALWILKNNGFEDATYAPKTKTRFRDVKNHRTEKWAAIYKLIDLGAIDPKKYPKKLLKPDGKITKREALEWLIALEGIPVPLLFDEAAFGATDVSASAHEAPLVNKAIELDLISAGEVALNRSISRGQAAHFLKTVKNNMKTIAVTILPTVDSDLLRQEKFDILASAWNRIVKEYLHRDEINKNELIYAAIEGIIKELDDKHSDFERPGNDSVIDSLSGEVEGIGAVIQMREEDDEILIVSPLVGSPAEAAGIQADDIIKEIDGVSVKGLKISEIANRIKGKKGTEVRLKILRGEEFKELVIIRDLIKVISASMKITDENIAIVTLANFGSKTASEFKAIVGEIREKKPKGIIIDMRNNPGGFLPIAVNIAGYFIKKGDVITNIRYPKRTNAEVSSGEAQLAGEKIVVIVNKGSASAAEILAGALQDYHLAQVVGETSYGKGTVQEISDFSDGSSLKITIAEWLTPSERVIEKNGIKPDIEVVLTDEDRAAKRDPQMEKALEIIRGG